jgi:hypothetical protein
MDRSSFLALLLLAASRLSAQELEPRAFSPGPVGANFLVASTAISTGDLVVDASIPIEDATADIYNVGLGYARIVGILGMTGKLVGVVPWTHMEARALITGQKQSFSWTGFNDPRASLTLLFLGAPALSGQAFAARRRGTVAGVTIGFSPPLGKYEPARVINLGANRWTFRGQLGVSQTAGRWTLEATAGGAVFTDNNEYLVSSTLEQDPIAALQGHIGYTFRPRLWAALDGNYYWGGRTSVNGVAQNTRQSNSRFGATVSVPLGRRHSLKLQASRGLVVRIGGNFNTVALTYQYAWGGGL